MDKLIKKMTGKKALLFTGIYIFFLILINFSSVGVAGLLKITDGANILDFELGFSHNKAYTMLTNLGNHGRSFYLTRIIPLDFLFPFSYALCYIGWIALLLKYKLYINAEKYLLWVPVLAMTFDWIENVSIIIMLLKYPILSSWIVTVASISGILKMLLIVSSVVIIIILCTVSFITRKGKYKKKGVDKK